MFASQAALVICQCAARIGTSLRARTDLETLIDTSPVGVVVFDAKTGAPAWFNREAARIIDALRTPDELSRASAGDHDRQARRWTGDIPEGAFDCPRYVQRRGDGAGGGNCPRWCPTAGASPSLINATPIHSEKGEIETCCRDHAGHDPAGGD